MKFKIGDKVKVIGACTNSGKIGVIVRLAEANDLYDIRYEDGRFDFHGPSCLELITSSTQESEEESEVNKMAKFKVGDKVKLISTDCIYGITDDMKRLLGQEVTIRYVHMDEQAYKIAEDIHTIRYAENQFILCSNATKTMTEEVKLTPSQEKNLSNDAKSLVKAGYYTPSLKINDESHFIKFLADRFESDYAKAAQAELDAADAEKKKAKKA